MATTSNVANLAFQNLATRSAIILAFCAAILISIPSWITTTSITRLPLPVHRLSQLASADLQCPSHTNATLNLQRLCQLTDQHPLSHQLQRGKGDPDATSSHHDPRVIQYASDVRLVFSLMNQHSTPDDMWTSSTLQHLGQPSDATGPRSAPDELRPILKLVEELKGVHNFHVESQTQWFAPLQITPTTELVQETREILVKEEYEEDVHEEIEVEDDDGEEVEEHVQEQASNAGRLDGTGHPNESGPLSASGAEADEAEAESLVQSADARDEVDSDAAEVDALLGTRQTHPPADKPRIPEAARRRRFRTTTRRQPRVRWVPRVEIHNHTQHLVEWDDLKVFVNSAEWSLTSAVAANIGSPRNSSARDAAGQTHDLHFIIYIPSAANRPLQIRDPHTGKPSDSTAWLIPQWGGVVLLNPNETSSDVVGLGGGDVDLTSRMGGIARARQVPSRQIQEAMTLFATQLETILGLSALQIPAKETDKRSASASEAHRARRAKIDALTARRALENTWEAIETLGGIVRLVEKIENLGVGPEIQQDVEQSINVLEELHVHLSGPMLLDQRSYLLRALELSYAASTLASRAFFSPKMLGLLYFPDEHKYAVYTPLFGPLLVPLLVALVKCVKESVSSLAQRRRRARLSSRQRLLRAS